MYSIFLVQNVYLIPKTKNISKTFQYAISFAIDLFVFNSTTRPLDTTKNWDKLLKTKCNPIKKRTNAITSISFLFFFSLIEIHELCTTYLIKKRSVNQNIYSKVLL